MGDTSTKSATVGHEPYRAQPLRPSERPRRSWRRALVSAVMLALVIVVPLYCCGGFYHLPARARAVCALSPSVGERFSFRRFRALSSVLGRPHQLSGRPEVWSSLGRWVFLRCYCHVEVDRGVVVRTTVDCFD